MSYHVNSSKVYSDGLTISLPPTPANNSILICPECNKAFWFDDAKTEESYKEEYPQAKDVHDLPFAFEDNFSVKLAGFYLDLLEDGFASSIEKEIYLRNGIWQLLNNKIRSKPNSFFYNLKNFSYKYALRNIGQEKKNKLEFEKNIDFFNENLKQLISIFEAEEDDQKLLLAEMYRELGAFENAEMLLGEITELKHDSCYAQISKAIKNKNQFVFKINYKNQ
jgi:uncharacterized protein YbaR (Trm112 family)